MKLKLFSIVVSPFLPRQQALNGQIQGNLSKTTPRSSPKTILVSSSLVVQRTT